MKQSRVAATVKTGRADDAAGSAGAGGGKLDSWGWRSADTHTRVSSIFRSIRMDQLRLHLVGKLSTWYVSTKTNFSVKNLTQLEILENNH